MEVKSELRCEDLVSSLNKHFSESFSRRHNNFFHDSHLEIDTRTNAPWKFILVSLSVSLIMASATPVIVSASSGSGNVNLLSQRFNQERYSSEIVGEVQNNGTEPVEFVKVAVTFYDSTGNVVGTENTYADPSDLRPGMKAPFKIFLRSDSVIADTATYGFTVSWDNLDGSTGVTTVSDQTLGQESGVGGDDQENEVGGTEEDGNN